MFHAKFKICFQYLSLLEMISFGEDISHSRTEDCNQYNVNNLGTEFLFTNLVPRAFSLPGNEVVC